VKLFLDSCRADEVREASAAYLLDGVTMNPSLLARERVALDQVIETVCELSPGPVSVPVRAEATDAIVDEGRALAARHERIVIKIPIHPAGLRAIARLHREGIRTHATLCCSPAQALLAARAGADWVSPLVGRVDESGGAGLEVVSHILEIYDNYEFDTQVMVASLRTAAQVQDAARLGVDAVTVSRRLLGELVEHPVTARVHEEFVQAWKKI
jgi:transaldolase